MFGIGLYVKIPNSEGSFKEKIKRIDFVGTYFLIGKYIFFKLFIKYIFIIFYILKI